MSGGFNRLSIDSFPLERLFAEARQCQRQIAPEEDS